MLHCMLFFIALYLYIVISIYQKKLQEIYINETEKGKGKEKGKRRGKRRKGNGKNEEEGRNASPSFAFPFLPSLPHISKALIYGGI